MFIMCNLVELYQGFFSLSHFESAWMGLGGGDHVSYSKHLVRFRPRSGVRALRRGGEFPFRESGF